MRCDIKKHLPSSCVTGLVHFDYNWGPQPANYTPPQWYHCIHDEYFLFGGGRVDSEGQGMIFSTRRLAKTKQPSLEVVAKDLRPISHLSFIQCSSSLFFSDKFLMSRRKLNFHIACKLAVIPQGLYKNMSSSITLGATSRKLTPRGMGV